MTNTIRFLAIIVIGASLPGRALAQGGNNLTNGQLQALKAVIVGDATLNAFPNNADGNIEVAAALNLNASPDYWVWRTALSIGEIYETTTADGTFWSWPIFIARSQGERDGWRTMVGSGSINPSLANTRQGIADIFSGAGGATQRTHLLAVARRKASRAEKSLAVATINGAGTRGSTANPDTMTFEGKLTHLDVEAARNLP